MKRAYTCGQIGSLLEKYGKHVAPRTIRLWFSKVARVNDPHERMALYDVNNVADVLAEHGFYQQKIALIQQKENEVEKAITILANHNTRILISQSKIANTSSIDEPINNSDFQTDFAKATDLLAKHGFYVSLIKSVGSPQPKEQSQEEYVEKYFNDVKLKLISKFISNLGYDFFDDKLRQDLINQYKASESVEDLFNFFPNDPKHEESIKRISSLDFDFYLHQKPDSKNEDGH
jgi:hypothetical protein